MPASIQNFYPDDLAWCYGCGRNNEHGHHFQTVWEGEETVTRFTPQPYHIAIPGYVYGGLLASLMDCHGTGSAALAAYRAAGRQPDDGGPPLRFVTASLRVDFRKPTPLGPELVARGRIREITGRKVVVEAWIEVAGQTTVRGEIIAVRMPENFASS